MELDTMPVVLVNMEQGSESWHDWRQTHRQASEAPIIMDCAPAYYETRTWEDLAQIKAGFAKPSPNSFGEALMHAGHEREKLSRQYIEDQTGHRYPPKCVQMGEYGASFDGLCLDEIDPLNPLAELPDRPIWAEIKNCKASTSKTWIAANRDGAARERIPIHIWWQMVHQAGVIAQTLPDSAVAELLVMIPDGKARSVHVAIGDLLADWPTLEAEWERFASGKPQYPIPDGWAEAESEYLTAARAADDAATDLAKAKKRLIKLAGKSKRVPGKRVSFVQFNKSGSISWKKTVDMLVFTGEVSQDVVNKVSSATKGADKPQGRLTINEG